MATEELSLDFYGVNPLASDVNLNEGPDSTKIIDNLNLNFKKSVSSDADFEALQKRHADGSDDLFETEVEDLDSDADMDTSSSSSSFLPSSQTSQDNSQEAWSKTLANLANAETQLPFNPKPKTPKKSGSNSEKLNLIIGLLNGKLLPQQAAAEKQTNSLIANQKHISLKINELSNEIQRSKLFTKCKINELVKDNIDREYERCNLVIYNLDIGNWHHYLKIYKNPKKAVFQLGLKFVNTFMAYDSRDLSVSKLVQNPGGENNREAKDDKHFRILLKLATPDDALRLKKRCFKRGFFTLRNGLTRKEREACAIIQQRVDSWNQKLNDKSETMFVRKFLFNIAEVDRSDSKRVIKWHESLESAEKYFESKITALAMIPIEMTKKTESLPDLTQKTPERPSESIPQKNLRNELLPNLKTPGTKKSMSKTASLPSNSPPRFVDPAIVESSTVPKKPNPKHKANLESTLSLSFTGVKRKATSPSHPLSPNGHPPSKRGRGRPALSAAQKKLNNERNKKRREAVKLAKAEAERVQQEELAKKQKEAEEAIQLMKEMRDEVSRLRAENKAKDKDASA